MRELTSKLSSSEWAEWFAYYNLNPFGPDVDDLRFGISTSMFANANRDPKKQKAFSLEDFMFSKKSRKKPRAQTWEEQLALVVAINKAAGGEDLRDN